MSRQQIMGQLVDARADLYALGARSTARSPARCPSSRPTRRSSSPSTTAERDELADSLRARALVRLRAGDETGGAADRARARAVFEELEMLGRLRAIDAPLEDWTCS